MNNKTLLQEIKASIKKLVGNQYLFLDECIKIEKCSIGALSNSPAGLLYVMDMDDNWHPVEENDLPENDLLKIYKKIKAREQIHARV